ncbi:MAG: HPF/RaiA family ribosome-associated protein [Desulfovibrionales bacterium]
MEVPLQVSYREVDKNDFVEDLIRKKVDKLEQVCDHIISCHVAIEQDQKFQRVGSPFRVRLDLRVPPGHQVVVKRESSGGDIHDKLPEVIRDAFGAARRKLKKLTEKQQGKTKVHPEQQAVALVTKLFPEEDYGFIKTIEGQDIYFHRNSVTSNDFDRLEVGTGVSFVAVEGEKGLQASTVHVVDKPGVRAGTMEEPRIDEPLGWEK